MHRFFSFLFLLLCPMFVAQTDSLSIAPSFHEPLDAREAKPMWLTLKQDARLAANGFLFTFARPGSWDQHDMASFGATVLGTGILYFNDASISDFARKQEGDIPHLISEAGFRFGKPQVNYAITGGVYVAGLVTKNEKVRYTGILMITSASVGGLVQQVVKTAAGRARPSSGLGYNHFKPFEGSPSYSSFPSGHTVLSVTTFYALSKQFSNPWVKAGFYTLGMVSPMSRIWEGAHWASDVFLSTAMSVAIVECVDAYLKKSEKFNLKSAADQRKISWNLKMGYNQIGLIGVF